MLARNSLFASFAASAFSFASSSCCDFLTSCQFKRRASRVIPALRFRSASAGRGLHAHARHVEHEKVEAHAHHTHAAFGIGLLHGLAGSSHFLGVLPILAFPTRIQALAYLLAFGLGTIASMAAFSWLMGSLAWRCAAGKTRIYRGLMISCAATAMVVGCFWFFQ